MLRLFDVHGPAGETHVQKTSTGTADVQTFTAPTNAIAAYVNCGTNDMRYTLDGTVPSATNGLLLKKDQNPVRIDTGKTIKFVSGAAANCVADLCWLK